MLIMQGLAIFGNVPTMIAQRLNIRMAELGLPHIKRTNMHVKNKIKKEHKSNARRVEALIAHQVSLEHPFDQRQRCI